VNDATAETKKEESKKSTKAVGGELEVERVTKEKKKGQPIEKPKADSSASMELSKELADAKRAKKYHSEDPTEPPKKKQKTSSSSIIPTVKAASLSSTDKPTKSKSKSTLPLTKSKPTSEPGDSPAVIQELQSQIKDILKSASSLAKAARARALNGDDDEKKSSDKMKKAA